MTLEINLNPSWVDCSTCGAPTEHRWGLPVDDCGDLIPNDAPDERMAGGIACCESCYEAHAQGLLTEGNRYRWKQRAELMRRAYQAAFARE